MRDQGHKLRDDRRGVVELPIKLMVVMILLTLMMPMLSNAAESSERDMNCSVAVREAERINDSLRTVYFSGAGSAVTVDVEPLQDARYP